MTIDRPSPLRTRTLLLVPAVAALYATAGCGAAFWDHDIDKGAPKDYLFTTGDLPPTTAAPAATGTTGTTGTTAPPTYATLHPAPTTPSPDEVDYVAVCLDPAPQTRVEDERCAEADEELDPDEPVVHSTGTSPVVHYWYYYDTRAGLVAARVGDKAAGGSYLTPRTGPTGGQARIERTGSVRPDGGAITSGRSATVQRGGLGTDPRSPAS